MWTDPGLKTGIRVREIISTQKKKEKSAGRERMVEHSLKIIAIAEKATTNQSSDVTHCLAGKFFFPS